MNQEHCPYCGNKVENKGNRYCSNCGKQRSTYAQTSIVEEVTDKEYKTTQKSVRNICQNCNNNQLQFVSTVETTRKENSSILFLMVLSAVVLVTTIAITLIRLEELENIKNSSNFDSITYIATYIEKMAQIYKTLQICYSIISGSGMLLLVCIIVHILKPYKIETKIVSVCPKCGEINYIDKFRNESQYSFIA